MIKKNLTKLKVKAVHKRRADSNKVHGIMPYGYSKDDDSKMVVNEEEAKIIRRIFDLSLEGKGAGKIAEILNDDNMPTRYNIIANKGSKAEYKANHTVNKTKTPRNKKDVRWKDKAVLDIIKNTVYKGQRTYSEKDYKVPHIIKPFYWQKVNDHLKENRNTRHARIDREHQYLLRGILRCGVCGRNYCGRINKRDNFYMCSSKRYKNTNCGNRGINIKAIEDFVWRRFFTDGEFQILIEKYFEEQSDTSNLDDLRAKNNKFKKDIAKQDRRLKNFIEMRADGEITKEELEARRNETNIKKQRFEDKREEVQKRLYAYENRDSKKEEIYGDINRLATETSFHDKQAIVDKYLDYIEVDDINDAYYLKFVFNIPNMKPEIYYMDRRYQYAYSIENQPYYDEEKHTFSESGFHSKLIVLDGYKGNIDKMIEGKELLNFMIQFNVLKDYNVAKGIMKE